MGKNTKKKFGKDGSTKFVLMHRSQQDADYGKEGASDLVLYPVDGSQLSVPRVERTFATSKDHVNGLGFANDGYDYEKHLRKIGMSVVHLRNLERTAQRMMHCT